MKRNTKIVRFITASLCLPIFVMSAGTAAELSVAQIKEITKAWECNLCPYEEAEKRTQMHVEAGPVAVSKDSFKHGDFTGLDEEGVYGVADIEGRYRSEEQYYFEILAHDLGLDAADIRLETGHPGRFRIRIDMSQLPKLQSDTAYTPLLGQNLELPASFTRGPTTSVSDMPDLDDALHHVNLLTRRRHLDAQADFIHNNNLSYDLRFGRKEKEGRKATGAAVGATFASANAVILPEFVDYTTDEWEVGANLRTKAFQLRVDYIASRFQNNRNAQHWDNPFSEPAGVDEAQLGSAPDNNWNQLALSLSTHITQATQASGYIAAGIMEQDDTYLPYAFGRNISALPQTSLGGKVNVFNADLQVSSRIGQRLQLNAGYNQEEQENTSARRNYSYVIADDLSITPDPRANYPFGFRRQRVKLHAQYAINADHSVSLTPQFNIYDRTYQEVSHTAEQAVLGAWRGQLGEKTDMSVDVEWADRDGGKYRPIEDLSRPENPLLRKFNLADRERQKAGVNINFYPANTVSLQLGAYLAQDKYDDSSIGLKDSNETGAHLDAQYALTESVGLTGFYSWTEIDSKQAGATWTADVTDGFSTAGLGVLYQVVEDKLKIGLDYIHAEGVGQIDYPASTGLPDLENTRETVAVHADYSWKENVDVLFHYRYEEYSETDWAMDEVSANTLSNVLGTGQLSPQYRIGVVGISVRYKM